jgi:hypothetical protein
LFVIPFLSHKFHNIENYFSFEVLKKKIWANLKRIIELFTQKIVTKPSKIWLWDPGSEIRDPEKTYSGSRIPDPGSRGLKGTGSRIRIRNIGRIGMRIGTNNYGSGSGKAEHLRILRILIRNTGRL